LPDLTLLAIKWRMERGRPFWHWVYFGAGCMARLCLIQTGALPTHRHTDFDRMRPKWFIEISDAMASHGNKRTRTKTDGFSPD
jgi:hypothetical protein